MMICCPLGFLGPMLRLTYRSLGNVASVATYESRQAIEWAYTSIKYPTAIPTDYRSGAIQWRGKVKSAIFHTHIHTYTYYIHTISKTTEDVHFLFGLRHDCLCGLVTA